MKAIFSAIISFLFPSKVAIWFLNQLGHQVHPNAYIGFSFLKCHSITLGESVSIGHFNLIRIPILRMGEGASIRRFNRMKGPMYLLMDKKAAIGNNNSIYRGDFPITVGHAELTLGEAAIITTRHNFDLTKSIHIGAFSTISGFATQFWTHGFYHADEGMERIRIDGAIHIGKNVSVGSKSLINPGVSIGDKINIGAMVCVSKSLTEPGMYVSQGLRFIPNSMATIKSKLTKNEDYTVVNVYEKSLA
ncbi:MAG: hypothetical protein AB8F74_09475 [Saprospiraceae bacterium]